MRKENCGFDVDWREYLRKRFEGEKVKYVEMKKEEGKSKGELVIKRIGIEGSIVYEN